MQSFVYSFVRLYIQVVYSSFYSGFRHIGDRASPVTAKSSGQGYVSHTSYYTYT